MKKSYSLLELILTILLISFLYTFFIPNIRINKSDELVNQISLYLSYVRFKALIDNKFDLSDNWHKKRWTLKFFRCRESIGGIYYAIYSDKNKSGHPNADDSLKDPLSQKKIYSSNQCEENNSNSKYVLLTKNFEIQNVVISCNKTDSLGQLSFDSNGKIYSKLSNSENDFFGYEITEPCIIEFISKDNNIKKIILYPETGYSKLE